MRKLLAFIGYTVLFWTLIANDLTSKPIQKEPGLQLEVKGLQLSVNAYLPEGISQFEVTIESDRNQNISRFTDISSHDKQAAERKAKYETAERDFWYPVVDVAIEPGMEGVCVFDAQPQGTYIFGGPFYTERLPLSREIIIPAHKLEYWENSLLVEPKEGKQVSQFFLRKTFPVVLREFSYSFKLLSEDWSGTVALNAYTDQGKIEIARQRVQSEKQTWQDEALESFKGSGLSRQRLMASLKALIKNNLRRQNNNPYSPTYGALHNFYDLDAKVHRTSYWIWGGAPFVKLAIDAVKYPEIVSEFDSAALMHSVKKIGQLYLKYQIQEDTHPSRGSMLVIWTRGLSTETGYTKLIGTSDTGMMMRWAILPLFEATGDSVYLTSAKRWCLEEERLLKEYDQLPHWHVYDEDKFHQAILDETGWDPEGHAALYEVTGEDRYRQIGKTYMDRRMRVFQREDGLWERNYTRLTKKVVPNANMTRGLGWAMEGLLATNHMYPDTIYLDYAKKMAAHLLESQLPTGAWSFEFTASPEEYGITEKGTAFWSLMFYQLYEATQDKKYLQAARKALIWCLENQYTGPDPEAIGSLVGRTPASAVGYRPYYPVSCAYTSGFLGLAILEELKLEAHRK